MSVLKNQYCYELLNCKRVCLIGGGWNGETNLEAFDLVWWTNDHYRPELPIDGLFTIASLPVPDDLPNIKVLHVNVPGTNETDWMLYDRAEVTFDYCSHEHEKPCPMGPDSIIFQRVATEIQTRLFTGFAAIAWLLSQPIRQLHITGFTFYESAEGAIPHQAGPHRIAPHREWLSRQRTFDPRITVDETLNRLAPKLERPIRAFRAIETVGHVIWKAEEIR